MRTQELHQKTKEDLSRILREKREKLCQLNFDLSSGKVKNVREIRMIKKDIARVLTILNQKSNSKPVASLPVIAKQLSKNQNYKSKIKNF